MISIFIMKDVNSSFLENLLPAIFYSAFYSSKMKISIVFLSLLWNQNPQKALGATMVDITELKGKTLKL